MTDFNYTHSFEELNSSLVTDVFYDEREQKAAVSLNDDVYVYDNVPFNEVEALVQANSIGRAFNGGFMQKGFKQKFGPGKHIGLLWDVTLDDRANEPVPAAAPYSFYVGENTTTTAAPGMVGKNMTYSPTATVDGEKRIPLKSDEPAAAAEPKRVALKAPVNEREDVAVSKFTVHFESNGSKTYETEAPRMEDAIKNLYDAADILGVRVKVTGVFVHLV